MLQNTLGMLIENHKHCRIPAVKRDKTTKRALMSKIIFTAFKSFPKVPKTHITSRYHYAGVVNNEHSTKHLLGDGS